MIKYLYCLISNLKDVYYEQAFISITSLRIHNPNAFVTLLADKETIDSIENRKADIKKIVDEIIVENFESNVSNLKRSRILKTIMRNRVDGDFLYIDGDTVICQSLNEIGNFQFDLGAVLDQHTLISSNIYKFSRILKIIFDKEDFYNYPYYFNGGLLFVSDTEFNRDFFRKWNENYFLGCKKNVPIDMPSLALTNYQLGFPIKELNGEWNVQVWFGVNYLHNAKIMHYFASGDGRYEPFFQTLPLKVKETGCLTEEDLSLIAQPRGFFDKKAFIIVDDNYEIYHSNIFRFLKTLYKFKFLFKLINKIFALPRIVNSKLYMRNINK